MQNETLANESERVYRRRVVIDGTEPMHISPPPTNIPLQVASHAERLAREQQGSRMGIVFQCITSICLGITTAKVLFDTIHEMRDSHARDRRHR